MSLSEEISDESKTPWFVYICASNAGHYYVGISPNPGDRVKIHNAGYGSKMARDQGKFKLVYVSNAYSGKSSARKREIQLKGWSRRKKEMLIKGKWE